MTLGKRDRRRGPFTTGSQDSGSVQGKTQKYRHYEGKQLKRQAHQMKTNTLIKPSTSQL